MITKAIQEGVRDPRASKRSYKATMTPPPDPVPSYQPKTRRHMALLPIFLARKFRIPLKKLQSKKKNGNFQNNNQY